MRLGTHGAGQEPEAAVGLDHRAQSTLGGCPGFDLSIFGERPWDVDEVPGIGWREPSPTGFLCRVQIGRESRAADEGDVAWPPVDELLTDDAISS